MDKSISQYKVDIVTKNPIGQHSMKFSFTSYDIRIRFNIGLRESERILRLRRELDEMIFMNQLEGLASEDLRTKS